MRLARTFKYTTTVVCMSGQLDFMYCTGATCSAITTFSKWFVCITHPESLPESHPESFPESYPKNTAPTSGNMPDSPATSKRPVFYSGNQMVF